MQTYLLFTVILLPVLFMAVRILKRRKVKTPLLLVISFGIVSMAVILYYSLSTLSKFEDARKFNAYMPTINAIQEYENATGAPPVDLNSLVPLYLQRVPSLSEKGPDFDEIIYNPDKKFGAKFVGESPSFTFIFFKSYSIAGEKEVQYCPAQFDCSYEVDFPTQVGSRVVTEKRTIKPDRVGDNWVRIENY